MTVTLIIVAVAFLVLRGNFMLSTNKQSQEDQRQQRMRDHADRVKGYTHNV